MNTFALLLLSAAAQAPPADYADHDATCLLGNTISQVIAPGVNEYEAEPYSDTTHVQGYPLTLYGVLMWERRYRIVGSRTNTQQGHAAMLSAFAVQYDRRKEYTLRHLGYVCDPIPPTEPWSIDEFPDPANAARVAYSGYLIVQYMPYPPTPGPPE